MWLTFSPGGLRSVHLLGHLSTLFKAISQLNFDPESSVPLTPSLPDAIKNAMSGKTEGGLDERPREILKLIIRSYVNSGEPVGSRTLAKSIDWRLSPATIRNIMADLEDEGYLEQPHTSAGRIPSERGYRFYVNHLADSSRVSKSDERYINRLLAESDTPEEIMSCASLILSTRSE